MVLGLADLSSVRTGSRMFSKESRKLLAPAIRDPVKNQDRQDLESPTGSKRGDPSDPPSDRDSGFRVRGFRTKDRRSAYSAAKTRVL